jgi:hypothetical protein
MKGGNLILERLLLGGIELIPVARGASLQAPEGADHAFQ